MRDLLAEDRFVSEPCDICGGSGWMTYPVRQPVSFGPLPTSEPMGPVMMATRKFPCPQCGDKTDVSQVIVLEAKSKYDTRYEYSEGLLDHVRAAAAEALARLMLEHNHIHFTESDEDTRDTTKEVVGRIGIVSKHDLVSLEHRVESCAAVLLDELIRRTDVQINNWGSQYDQKHIDKQRAMELMREAREQMRKRQR